MMIPETEKRLLLLQWTLSVIPTGGFVAFDEKLLIVMVKAMEMMMRREDILEALFF